MSTKKQSRADRLPSGFATAVIGVAGLVALINYLIQIAQAVKS